jgi:hypothetical protein
MGEATQQPSQKAVTETELRTIAFRMREIQRLMAMRVEQENRRLEASGLEPVTSAPGFGTRERPPEAR